MNKVENRIIIVKDLGTIYRFFGLLFTSIGLSGKCVEAATIVPQSHTTLKELDMCRCQMRSGTGMLGSETLLSHLVLLLC